MAASIVLSLLLLQSAAPMLGISSEANQGDRSPTGHSWTREHSRLPPDLEVEGRSRQFPNISVFRVLRHGCFDLDVTQFCGNRLTGYGCLFWIDTHATDKAASVNDAAKLEDNLRKAGLDANFFETLDFSSGIGAVPQQPEAGSSKSFNSDFEVSVGENATSSTGSTGTGTFRGLPPLVETTDDEEHSPPSKNQQPQQLPRQPQQSAATSDESQPDCTVYRGRVDIPTGWRRPFAVALPIAIAIGGIGCAATAVTFARLGRRQLPVCCYLAIVSCVDVLELLIHAGDLWLRAISSADVTFMLLFACQTCCQVYPMVYSFAHHLRQLCYVAAAVDTLALYQRPVQAYRQLSRERVFNSCALFCAILLSVNCQFLWTFSLSRTDSHSPAGNRGYHCGFSDKWVALAYRSLVWPGLDFFLGDLLPTATAAWCSFEVLRLLVLRRMDTRAGGSSDRDKLRSAALLASVGWLPLCLPEVCFHAYRLCASAEHALRHHILPPQSIRRLLDNRHAHLGWADRNSQQDQLFCIDTACWVARLTWLCTRAPLLAAVSALFRRKICGLFIRSAKRLALRATPLPQSLRWCRRSSNPKDGRVESVEMSVEGGATVL